MNGDQEFRRKMQWMQHHMNSTAPGQIVWQNSGPWQNSQWQREDWQADFGGWGYQPPRREELAELQRLVVEEMQQTLPKRTAMKRKTKPVESVPLSELIDGLTQGNSSRIKEFVK